MGKFHVSFDISLEAETIEDAETQLGIAIALDAKQLITNFKIVKEKKHGDIQTSQQ
tara:strand:- start:1597 stop:1764 length:168 start_codon:yes stop_codon:yes gene_type:complete